MSEEIAVMDYSTHEIHIYTITEDDLDMMNFLKLRGHRADECTYMFSEHIKVVKH